jgi:choline dehydrogenase
VAALYCKSDPGVAVPDLQLMFAPASFDWKEGLLERAGGMSLAVWVSNPDSHGTVMAESPDPFAKPSITPRYMTADSDWQRLLAGIKIARRIYSAPSLARWSVRELDPGPTVVSDQALKEFALGMGQSGLHLCGTCKMGVDDNAVVDLSLRVRGVDGLRVVDASVFPMPVSGGMNASIIATAEKAAHLMKN